MAPSRADIIVVPETLRLTTGGAVRGQLWLRVEAPHGTPYAVPEAGWHDFPVPVLSWWPEALALVASGAKALARYYPAGLELGAVVPDVDVSTLDAGHVLPNI